MGVTILSGADSSEATVDPTSKALRITEYLSNGAIGWKDNYATYSAFNAAFTPPATPTDVVTIYGSATKTVAVLRAFMSTIQTTAGINSWYLAKRSSAHTGGVQVQATLVPHDSSDAAASNGVNHWTTLFTGAGALVGNIWSGKINSPAAGTAGIGGYVGLQVDFTRLFGKPIILRGVAESINWNFNGVALPAGLSVLGGFTWVEY